ncbi:hypothetical protein [Actinomadura scrupuli]|uniref:hypothetical protein n=1 Tax=Actinomadura scrupuli TaxID=559629 RepID=UPI003D99044E
MWLAGIGATLVGALVLVLVPQIVDAPAAKDKVRGAVQPGGGQDVRFSVQFNDPAIQLVTPAGVTLTPRQRRYLSTWKFGPDQASQNPDGYGMDKLIAELRAAGAANPDELYLLIRLEGRRNQPLFVDDVRPVDIKRARPYAGTLVNIPPQEGGDTSKMIFNFDEVDPRAHQAIGPEGGPYKPGGLFFNDKTLTIKDGEQDSILVKSITTRSAVTFEIQIDYRIGGRPKHLKIDNRGRPFALTPFNCTKRTELTKNGFNPGEVSYQDIWTLGATSGIDHVSDPAHHPFGSPWCLTLPR